jgi:L-arabinose transport system substrate-binding protein
MYRMIGIPFLMVAATLGGCSKSTADDKIKVGFVVKQPEEPWFQSEWKFAQQAADKDGFTLIKIAAPDGDTALAAIDNLATQGAKGLVICVPDTHMGQAIVNKCQADGLKLLSVDDQFVGPDNKPMDDVHHLGISATKIGRLVGSSLAEQMKARGWAPGDTALCAITFERLQTAQERVGGAVDALTESGFPANRCFKTAEQSADVPAAIDATNNLLSQHPDVKHWMICGTNDSAVIGGVRAMEGRNFSPDDVCAIGINGTDCLNEFKKEKPTGMWGSILLTPKRHGFDTAEMMFHWIKDGSEPPKITYTDGFLITRDTYQKIMKDQGLLD